MTASPAPSVSLGTVLVEWGRLGCTGFGGPPAHIALLRRLCVERRGWLSDTEFEDAVAACNLLPGPASTQLAIFCAWRVRGRLGAVVGGAAFIVPGLLLILALAALFLTGSPPAWVSGAGAGAGAAVAAVAVQAGAALAPASRQRAASLPRWAAYLLAGGIATVLLGPWLVVVLVACGVVEVLVRGAGRGGSPGDGPAAARRMPALPVLAGMIAGGGVLASIGVLALKVGALSYGGGFVIIPMMRADAVDTHHWMTDAQFLDAVALGQVTPGPVVQTIAVVGYAAAGLGGGLLASVVAFAPSFAFVLIGGDRFDSLRGDERVRAFLDGAGPAAIGAILGSAVTLAAALSQPWQYALLTGAAVALLVLRRGVVPTLLVAGAVGALLVGGGVVTR